MKKWIISLVMVLLLAGCSRILVKEYDIVDGKSHIKSEMEYDRWGDQKIAGGKAEKTTPDTSFTLTFDEQESKGESPVIKDLTEVIVKYAAMGIDVSELEAIKSSLENVNP